MTITGEETMTPMTAGPERKKEARPAPITDMGSKSSRNRSINSKISRRHLGQELQRKELLKRSRIQRTSAEGAVLEVRRMVRAMLNWVKK
jgi:hypothetical protein